MSAPWETTEPVDAARAATLVGAVFPELHGAPARAVADGWDNSVLLVGDVLFRFPRRESAVELQRRELAVLPLVAPHVPLAVPVPTHLGEPVGDYPWPFWGGPMVAGDELATLPEHADRRHAAEAAGSFLRALHDGHVEVELPVDPMSRASPALRAERTRSHLRSLADQGAWQPSPDVYDAVELPLGPPDAPQVLSHGDLHLRHLLVDEQGRATGVIDWGDTCFAHPAVDLSLAFAAFAGPARAAMLSAYGGIDHDTEQRARALAVSLCAGLADAAAAVGDRRLLREYLHGIQRAVS